MAEQEGNENKPRAKRHSLRYFFLNDELHRKLQINRGKDLVTSWNYPQGKKVVYSYSDTLKKHKPAFTTVEVVKMIGRSRLSIELAITSQKIRRPPFTYSLDEKRRIYQYMWREKDIMELHEYFSNTHRGRPRKDGSVTNNDLPTPRELRAIINHENILYVKQGNVFVPSWKAKEF